MKIIGGVVSFEDGVKTTAGDQFSPTRKVRVELNFSLDDGDNADQSISTILDKAHAFVNGKLGLKVSTAAAVAQVTKTPAVASDKDKLAEEAGLPAGASGDVTPKPAAAPKAPRKPAAAKPAADGELGTEAPPIAAKPAPADDGLGDLLGEEKPAAKVTDAELNDAVQKKNQDINSPENPGGPRIRKVVAAFLDDPTEQPLLREIPEAKRAAFLTELAKLTK